MDITAETITNEQIYALRDAAEATGNTEMMATCDRALYGTPESPGTILALIEDGHLSEAQIEARKLVADAINQQVESAMNRFREAHRESLTPGVRVRLIRGRAAGIEATVIDTDPDNSTRIMVLDDDGLRWSCEPQYLELITDDAGHG